MKRKILISIFILLNFQLTLFAHSDFNTPQVPSTQIQRQFDSIIETRLKLTNEQINILKSNRTKHLKEIKAVIDKMEKIQIEIRNVYMTGIPKWQADLRTATKKTELVLLKQEADNLKEKRKKEFENLLTPQQKTEFEKLKKELAQTKPNHK